MRVSLKATMLLLMMKVSAKGCSQIRKEKSALRVKVEERHYGVTVWWGILWTLLSPMIIARPN